MKHSLTISRRCSDQLLERSLCRISYCACIKALPLPMNTRCSSVLWWQLAVGAKQLSPALSGRDWIPVSALRWRYMMRIGNLHAKGQTHLPATPPKPFTSPSHPPMVSPVPEPIQVDTAHFSSHERWQARAVPLLCFC